jgi:hypothetical protein
VIAYDSASGRLGRDDEQRLFAGKIDKRPPDKAMSGLPTVVSAPELAEVDLVFLALHGGRARTAQCRRCSISPGFLHRQRPARQRARLGQGRREAVVPRSRRADWIGSWRCSRSTSSSMDRFPVDRKPNALDCQPHARPEP